MTEEQQEPQPVATTKQIKELFDAGALDDDAAIQLLRQAGAGDELARTTLQSWRDAATQAQAKPDEQPGD